MNKYDLTVVLWLALGASGIVQATTVSSAFDEDAEGWSVADLILVNGSIHGDAVDLPVSFQLPERYPEPLRSLTGGCPPSPAAS